MRNHYKPGTWNALCDVCGFKFKADQLQKRWDGRMVCKEDFETRHPSDLFNPPKESGDSVPWARPEPDGTFITVDYITPPE
jgi:hypothetical protein